MKKKNPNKFIGQHVFVIGTLWLETVSLFFYAATLL